LSGRRCVVCSRSIDAPDEYFNFGHLTSDPSHPLFRFNYVQVHRSHLAQIPGIYQVKDEMRQLQRSGAWQGRAGSWLLGEVERALAHQDPQRTDPS
jgi:hypothetical protein